jgi:DNA-binding response OmpR family regulator
MLVCMMIEDMLADLGCESVTAARKALDLIDARVFDAATLDMNLNGNDSHRARRARRALSIHSTGNKHHYMRDSYHDRPVLKKPFKYEALVEILTRLLSRRSGKSGSNRANWSFISQKKPNSSKAARLRP